MEIAIKISDDLLRDAALCQIVGLEREGERAEDSGGTFPWDSGGVD